jgi:hypothetical protein
MKPDGMLVEPDHIMSAVQQVGASGSDKFLAEIGQTEPALASFVGQNLLSIAGKLALAGAPTEVVQGVHEDALVLVLSCIQALRRGHYELWKDAMTGSRLAQLDEQFQAPKKQRRKKNRSAEAGE